jgi:hypothetical protein
VCVSLAGEHSRMAGRREMRETFVMASTTNIACRILANIRTSRGTDEAVRNGHAPHVPCLRALGPDMTNHSLHLLAAFFLVVPLGQDIAVRVLRP